MTAPAVSVILPAKDEEGSIAEVVRGIGSALAAIPHEVLVVDDGSGDGTAAQVEALMPDRTGLRLLRHAVSCGQSAAIRTGVLAARGRIVVTLDADGQNPPSELPLVLAPLLAPNPDPALGLVQGQRTRRQDTLSRRLASRAANRLRAALLGDGLRDSACGLKAFPREVYLGLPYFDHMHRYMGALVIREGYDVVAVDVAHAPRRAGRSKYGNLGRALVGVVDLVGVAWLMRRRRLPIAVEAGLAAPTPFRAMPALRPTRLASPAGASGAAVPEASGQAAGT